LIVPHIDIDNVCVADESILQSAGIRVINEVAGDVQASDGAVKLQELREGLTEHVTKTVRGEGKTLKEGVVIQQVCAELGTSLVINTVQLEVQMAQTLVDLQGLCDVAGTLVVDTVISKVHVGQDLGGEDILGQLTSSRVADLVVTEVKLSDCLIQDKSLY
jgi:hypothetical protein